MPVSFFSWAPSLTTPWKNRTIASLDTIPSVVCAREDVSCNDALKKLNAAKAAAVVVNDARDLPVGLLTPALLVSVLAGGIADLKVS